MIRILLILLAISCTQTSAEVESAQELERKNKESQAKNCEYECHSYGLPFRGMEFVQTLNAGGTFTHLRSVVCKCGY